jgi:hypothetical protein
VFYKDEIFIQWLADNIPIDSEVSMVTSSISRSSSPTKSFEGTHRDRVCMYVFIWISACMCMYVYTMFLKKLISFLGIYVAK